MAAMEEFDRLKALREELPNEPITDPDLEQKETTSPNSSGITLQACPVGQAGRPLGAPASQYNTGTGYAIADSAAHSAAL